jgi:hypothetical protein
MTVHVHKTAKWLFLPGAVAEMSLGISTNLKVEVPLAREAWICCLRRRICTTIATGHNRYKPSSGCWPINKSQALQFAACHSLVLALWAHTECGRMPEAVPYHLGWRAGCSLGWPGIQPPIRRCLLPVDDWMLRRIIQVGLYWVSDHVKEQCQRVLGHGLTGDVPIQSPPSPFSPGISGHLFLNDKQRTPA